MAVSKAWENLNLEDLYKSPWFFGELSEEEAKKILVEAKQNDGNSKAKSILFLKTVLWSPSQPRLNGKKHFTVVDGQIWQHDLNGQPQFIFYEDIWFLVKKAVKTNPFKNSVMRENPFSLEELAKIKIAISGVNPETLGLPKRFEDEVKKYQALNERLIQSPLLQLDSSPLTPEISDEGTLEADLLRTRPLTPHNL